MLARITKTYGGQEGRRVKPGTIFAIGTPQGDLPTMSLARFRQLEYGRLAEEYDPAEDAGPAPAPPRRSPARIPGAKVEPDSAPPTSPAKKKTPTARTRALRRAQEDEPKEPRPLARPRPGGPAGTEEPASSSPEVRQAGSVTLTQRGTRRRGSAGSPLTTPTSSSPGPTPSTPATQNGGESTTTGQPDSAAFE